MESARSRGIYADSIVWWEENTDTSKERTLKTLKVLITAGADVNLAPRVLHDTVDTAPASLSIAGAVGEKTVRMNGVYDVVRYIQTGFAEAAWPRLVALFQKRTSSG